jgi:hypothetical protein
MVSKSYLVFEGFFIMIVGEFKNSLLLMLQAALLGNVTGNMLAVLVSWRDENIFVRIVFDENISEEDLELVSVIETELIADLPSRYSVKCYAENYSCRDLMDTEKGEILVFKKFVDD